MKTIARLPDANREGHFYQIEAALPDTLRTSLARSFPFRQNMTGTARIFTKDRRLLERLLGKFWRKWIVFKKESKPVCIIVTEIGPSMSNKFFETLQTLERLDGLIRRKATGKPGALAQRLGSVSGRCTSWYLLCANSAPRWSIATNGKRTTTPKKSSFAASCLC
ncbi:MAG: hypothetical protein IPK21_15365 [Haliscomenobacter sp.]|nr:hypothetical protein [Haliscomenobacter sp.]